VLNKLPARFIFTKALGSTIFLAWFAVSLFARQNVSPMHPRPANVPSSAVWADNAFIECSIDPQSHSNRCTVFKDETGEILADGLFVLGSSRAAAQKSELHYAGFGTKGIYLQDLKILLELRPAPRDPSNRIIDAELQYLASKGGLTPVNCNSADSSASINVLTDCAINAFAAKRPFYVRYYRQFSHSFGYSAFAGDAVGDVYSVDWDSGDEHGLGDTAGTVFRSGARLTRLVSTSHTLDKVERQQANLRRSRAKHEVVHPP
jgi:hypothetical protein